MKKQILSIFLAVLMVLTMIPQPLIFASAAVIKSGECGSFVAYALLDNGELIIKGFGAINNYDEQNKSPFYGNKNIKKVIINEGVTSIGDNAFESCTGLTEVTIPTSVTSIGYSAFEFCTGLTSINVDSSNTVYSSVDSVVFNKDKSEIVLYPKGKTGVYSIPTSVTSIGNYAFNGCIGLDSVTIPSSVTSIGDNAFRDCTGLTTVTIPDSVTFIGVYTFEGCTGLTAVAIPSSVTSIGTGAFSDCTGITAVTIPSSVTSIGTGAFDGCTGLTAVTIPSSVTYINSFVFSNCTGLTAVTIPSSVTYIGDFVFSGCTGLTEVTIPSSVTSIGYFVFSGCTGLTEVTIPSSVTSIGDSAFSGCTGLTAVTIPTSVTSIGDSVFYGCTGLTAVTIPTSVTSIGNNAFAECTGLTAVTIPTSVTSIDYAAFAECTGLTEVAIPSSVTSIGDSVFYGCTGLTAVTIPSSVTSIGRYAFYGCTGLTAVTIPSSVTSIDDYAFEDCTGLTSINVDSSNTVYSSVDGVVFNKDKSEIIQYPVGKTGAYSIPTSVTSIGDEVFRGCTGLTEVTIPTSVTSIGRYAFYGCTGLTAVTIPDSVTSIGVYAFEGCTGLTAVAIPSSVTSINDSAFRNCTGLIEVTIPSSVTSIGDWAFKGCTGLTAVTIPSSVTSIGVCAFEGCTGITSVTIPSSVTSIGWGAFRGCTGLASINVDSSNTVYSSVDGILFNKDKSTIIQYPAGKTGAYSIPTSVTSIGDDAFRGCTGLTEVTIPTSVTSIGRYAFYGCTGLTAVTTPSSVTSIGDDAFEGCTGLTAVIIPSSVTSIGDWAFNRCTAIKNVYYKGSEADWGKINIGNYNDCLTSAQIHYNFTYPDHTHIFGDWITVTEPTCTKPGLRQKVCSVCGYAETEELAVIGHTMEDVAYKAPACTVKGNNAYYHCTVCDKFFKDTDGKTETLPENEIIPATGHTYESLHVDATENSRGYTEYKCKNCGYTYRVNDPASAPAGFIGYGSVNAVNLSWAKAIEISVTGYRIYRKTADGAKFELLSEISSRDSLSYIDTDVVPGTEYTYILCSCENEKEGTPTKEIKVSPLYDEEPPRILTFSPANGKTVNGSITVKVTAEDNVGIAGYEFYYSAGKEDNWISFSKGEQASAVLDTSKLPDGIIKVKAVAEDTNGNKSNGSPVQTYMADNTAPGKVTGLKAESVLSSVITLTWDKPQAKDTAYFMLQKLTDSGYVFVNEKISGTLGCNIKGLEPDCGYTFRVCAADALGNIGEYSDLFTVKTAADTTEPVISALSPSPQRFRDNIHFCITASDDCAVKSLRIQSSYDAKTWTDIYTVDNKNYSSVFSASYDISLSGEKDGSIYLRAVAEDRSGNISDSTEKAPCVEYYVDKTSPAAPAGVIAQAGDGYNHISWDKSSENDIRGYDVYRSVSADGTYEIIASGLRTIDYYDRSVQRGETYYYKVKVSDTCGNVSEFSEPVSAAALEDTVKPVINSISPANGVYVSPIKSSINVLASDNGTLKRIVIETKYGENGSYQIQKEFSDINSYYKNVACALNLSDCKDGDKIYVRAYCEDTAGNISENSSEYVYTVDKTAPGLNDLKTEVNDSSCVITWTSKGEPDLAGFRIYVSENGGNYKNIGSRGINITGNYTFTFNADPGTYDFRIDSYDKTENFCSFYSDSVIIKNSHPEENVSVKAQINCPVFVEKTVEEQYFAVTDIASSAISRWHWDFGDGTFSEEENPVKAYKETGSFTVTLTVWDIAGNTGTASKTVKVSEHLHLRPVKVRLKDNSGNIMSYKRVFFDLGEPEQQIVITDGSGIAQLPLPVGMHKIGSYENGYLPASKNINVLADSEDITELILVKQDIITGEFEVHEMTFDEIKAAGIDISDPANQQVYTVHVTLVYGREEIPVRYVRNNTGIIEYVIEDSVVRPGGGSSGGNSDEGSGTDGVYESEERKISDIKYIPNKDNKEILSIMDVPVHASYLKQFFSANLYIVNNAEPGYIISGCTASMAVPKGLTVMSHTPIADTIDGQQTASANWILRGDTAGSYDLCADFRGTLQEFNEPIEGSFKTKEPVKVRSLGETFSVEVEIPDYIFFNPPENCNDVMLGKDEPTSSKYKFVPAAYFNVGMKNICDSDVNCADIGIDTGAFTVKDQNGKIDPKAEVKLKAAFIESGEKRTPADMTKPVILKPGEMLIKYYAVENISMLDTHTDKKKGEEFFYYSLTDHYTSLASDAGVAVNIKTADNIFYDFYVRQQPADKINFTYSSAEKSMDRTVQIDYSDSYFNADSREYNKKLAELSIGTVMSGFSDTAYYDSYHYDLAEGNCSRATNIIKAYSQMGFTDDRYFSYNVSLGDFSDKVAFSAAKKYIKNEKGETDTVIAVVLRGGGYGAEWAGNFCVGEVNDHAGFDRASDFVIKNLGEYVSELNSSGKIKGNLKIWMTGYSRSAATGNITAHKLNKAGSIGGVSLKPQNLFAYLFAVPMGAYENNEKNSDLNIFCFVSPLDAVPMVAPEKWNFSRYGRTLPFSVCDVSDKISSAFNAYEGVDDLFNITSSQVDTINIIAKILVPFLVYDREVYAGLLENTLREIMIMKYSKTDLTWIDIFDTIICDMFNVSDLTMKDVAARANVLGLGVLTVILLDKKGSEVYEAFKLAVNANLGALAAKLVLNVVKDIIKTVLTDNFVSGILTAHHPEYYLSCLINNSYNTVEDFNKNAIFKKIEVSGDGTIKVFFTGALRCAPEQIPVEIRSDGSKVVYIRNENYRVEITGNGQFDYTITENDGNGGILRTLKYYDVPVAAGETLTQNIKTGTADINDDYELIRKDGNIMPDEDSLKGEIKTYSINITGGNADCIKAEEGETVYITAAAQENDMFSEWAAASGDIQFNNNNSMFTSFVMPGHDVSITALTQSSYASELSFVKNEIKLAAGACEKAELSVLPENAYLSLEWSSENPEIAKIDADGNVTAVSAGKTVISVTDRVSGLSSSCTVFVGTECEINGHKYETVKVMPTCTEKGYTEHICSVCGYSFRDSETEPTGHTDADKDSYCDNCGKKLSEENPQCNHICHSQNKFMQFLWKVINFFNKLFKVNQYCECGARHW